MAKVYIPSQLRHLTQDQEILDISGSNVREVIDSLDQQFPGMKSHLCPDGRLAPGIAVAVDAHVTSAGLRETVHPDSEIHFLPAVSGG